MDQNLKLHPERDVEASVKKKAEAAALTRKRSLSRALIKSLHENCNVDFDDEPSHLEFGDDGSM